MTAKEIADKLVIVERYVVPNDNMGDAVLYRVKLHDCTCLDQCGSSKHAEEAAAKLRAALTAGLCGVALDGAAELYMVGYRVGVKAATRAALKTAEEMEATRNTTSAADVLRAAFQMLEDAT